MELTGDYLIPAPRKAVWAALNEPALLQDCVPGCDEIARMGDTLFEGRVHTQIGPLKMRFGGRLELENLDLPHGYTLGVEAGGGAGGVLRMRADIRMTEVDGMTRLTYTAQLVTGGAIAQLAPGLLQAEIARLAQQFFRQFNDRVGSWKSAGASAETAPAKPLETALPSQAAARPDIAGPQTTVADAAAEARPMVGHLGLSLAPSVWIPVLVVLVGLLLYIVTRHGA